MLKQSTEQSENAETDRELDSVIVCTNTLWMRTEWQYLVKGLNIDYYTACTTLCRRKPKTNQYFIRVSCLLMMHLTRTRPYTKFMYIENVLIFLSWVSPWNTQNLSHFYVINCLEFSYNDFEITGLSHNLCFDYI